MKKPILCLDFDGVIHSYTSGWQGAAVIPDPMVPGALHFIWDAQDHFTVAIYSSRSGQLGGIAAMQRYLQFYANGSRDEGPWCDDPHLGFLEHIEWPTEKPPAMLKLMGGLPASHGQAKEHLIEQIGDRLRATGIGEEESAALADDLITLILDNVAPKDPIDCDTQEDEVDSF